MRMLKRLAIALVALLVLGGAGGLGLQGYYKSRIFNPVDDVPDAAPAPFAVETVSVATPDGLALNAWWHAPGPGGRVVLYLHGNANNMEHYIRGVAPLAEAGHGFLMIDYRGYGGNPGELSDEGFLVDARAALDWLGARSIPSREVTLYGYSLGTGVAVPLAAEREVAGVILAAPFASIAEMGYDSYPRWFVDMILEDRFDSIGQVAAVEEDILIFHGTDDRTVPVGQSARLAAAGGDNVRRIVIEGAGHGWDLFEPAGNALVLEFLAGRGG